MKSLAISLVLVLAGCSEFPDQPQVVVGERPDLGESNDTGRDIVLDIRRADTGDLDAPDTTDSDDVDVADAPDAPLDIPRDAPLDLAMDADRPDVGEDPDVVEEPDVGTDGSPSATNLVVWGGSGESKVLRHELRASEDPQAVRSLFWDGTTVQVDGAGGEVIGFSVVLEAPEDDAEGVTVTLDSLQGPGDARLGAAPREGLSIFDWRDRQIELFYVRYLEIKGLSYDGYSTYDERHIPSVMRRPFQGEGYGTGVWADRPGANKFFPEIAVPIELVETFDVEQGRNQSIWVDVYVPPGSPAGTYEGTFVVREAGEVTHRVPIELEVHPFELPARPSLGTAVFMGEADIGQRYLGPDWQADRATLHEIRDRHFQLAWRHRIALIDNNSGVENDPGDRPQTVWFPRLDGTLFTPANGYEGPGQGEPLGVFAVGAHGNFAWRDADQETFGRHAGNWVEWFDQSAPGTDYFLWIQGTRDNEERLAAKLNQAMAPANRLRSMSIRYITEARETIPSLDIVNSWVPIGIADEWEEAARYYIGTEGKALYMYKGRRPGSGSFAIEDDGVALRSLAWCQHKHRVDRWMYWESTYYDNYQGQTGQTNVWRQAKTSGNVPTIHFEWGEFSVKYSNGNGVLFYPGRDLVFQREGYDVAGPIASLRLKHWRRGLQDGDYLALAAAIDPERTREIVADMLPTSLWEYGVDNPRDPTYVRTDISWSTDPDDWKAARQSLVEIITRPR